MNSIKEIDTNVPEGKVLLAAIAVITTSPQVNLNGKLAKGTQLSPDEAFTEVIKLAEFMYKEQE